MEYQEESYWDVIDELRPMLQEHYKEVAMYQDDIDLNFDEEKYRTIDHQDALRIFTMREEGKLVGYNVFFVSTHIHYMDHIYAQNDVVYIDPEYRGSECTPTFFKRCDNWLKEEGVSVITYHMKVNKPFQALMDFLEFDHAEHIYTKYVG